MFREIEFEYQITPGWIVAGIVSGELIKADADGGDEVKNLRIDAKVYYGDEDERGTDLRAAYMSDATRDEIEEYCIEQLWGDE